MKINENNNDLDELLCGVVSGNKPRFNFDKWKEEHKEQVEIFQSQKDSASATFEMNTGKIVLLRRIGYLAAALLVVSTSVACFVLTARVTRLKEELARARQTVAPAQPDDSATINFYLKEHQEVVAQHASMNQATAQPGQMHVGKDDILYYELLDGRAEATHPGVIVRGPSSQAQISVPNAPTISNGHTLSLSQAKHTANFDLVAPAWLHPYYRLDQIRTIKDRDALQLLYTNGIDSISLFEQPLDGRRGLEPKDFREYAVYQNKGQGGGTILAWRDDALSYVLIGNIKLSQLMNMAQFISAGK
jgi:hypothetical protein